MLWCYVKVSRAVMLLCQGVQGVMLLCQGVQGVMLLCKGVQGVMLKINGSVTSKFFLNLWFT